MCLVLILFGIHKPEEDDKKAVKKKLDFASFSALVKLDSAPWRFVVILGVLFSLARFSNDRTAGGGYWNCQHVGADGDGGDEFGLQCRLLFLR